jgi:FeS assembly SUF system protein
MADEYKHPNSLQSLNVLPHSGKVDQLKAEIQQEGGLAKKLADQNVIDRAVDPTTTPRQKLIREKVIDAVRGVYDPEIPINIYDLGLIYEINVLDDDTVHVKMTLTAPACPVAGTLPGEVEKRIEHVPEVKSAKVELVWEPPWDKSRMSEEAILELGL